MPSTTSRAAFLSFSCRRRSTTKAAFFLALVRFSWAWMAFIMAMQRCHRELANTSPSASRSPSTHRKSLAQGR